MFLTKQNLPPHNPLLLRIIAILHDFAANDQGNRLFDHFVGSNKPFPGRVPPTIFIKDINIQAGGTKEVVDQLLEFLERRILKSLFRGAEF